MDKDSKPTEGQFEPLTVNRLNEYFANKPSDEIVSELQKKVQDYYRYLNTSGKLGRWEKSYRYYYGADERGFSALGIGRSGSQGELSTIRVNHYRNLTQSLLTLTTSQVPAYEIRATNTDYKSQSQTIIGSALLDYYVKEKDFGSVLKDAAEFCLIFDEGYIYSPWDQTIGEELAGDIETGLVLRKGDIRYEAKSPVDIIRDTNSRSAKTVSWYIVRSFVNRYNLAAERPDLTDEILSISPSSDRQDTESFLINNSYLEQEADSDLIPVYEFWHDRTPAVSDGKYVRYVGDVLLDEDTLEDLEYDCIPLNRMAASEQAFTSHGYSNQLDLIGIQEAVDQTYSIILSNQSAFGVQNLWKKPGEAISVSQLQGGLNLIESEDKPEAITLLATPAEIFNFAQTLENVMEKLSGINSTVRGDPGSNLKSGAALALVASQAIQLMGNISSAYDNLFESVGTLTFKLLQKKANHPRMVAIVGKFNSSYLEQFTGSDIEHVARVVVEKGNHLTKTAAGRVELANALLQTGMITTPQEYISVVQTGRLEPLTEAPMAELLLIRSENEALRAGRPVKAVRGDNHDLHIAEHRSLIASPEARTNPELLAAVLAHIEEHEELKILEAQRQMQIQARLQQPPQPVPANNAPAINPPAPANPNAVVEANQPSMPINPLTNEQYQPVNQ